MKDNQASPFFGQPPKIYDPQYFDRAFRALEVHLQTLHSVGPIRVNTINIASLPTSATGLRSGDIWSDDGVLRVIDGQSTSGTFTPAVTFGTPGDLAVVYATQEGTYQQVGKLVFVRVRLVFTPTFTTASGSFTITGLPAACVATPTFAAGGGPITNISAAFVWPAGVTQVCVGASANTSNALVQGTGDAINQANFTEANLTSAGSHTLVFSLIYEAA